MGRDAGAVRRQGREWHPACVWIRRRIVATMRELLGLLQHLLRAGPVVVGVLPLRHRQWSFHGVDLPILPPRFVPGDYVLVYRPRTAV